MVKVAENSENHTSTQNSQWDFLQALENCDESSLGVIIENGYKPRLVEIVKLVSHEKIEIADLTLAALCDRPPYKFALLFELYPLLSHANKSQDIELYNRYKKLFDTLIPNPEQADSIDPPIPADLQSPLEFASYIADYAFETGYTELINEIATSAFSHYNEPLPLDKVIKEAVNKSMWETVKSLMIHQRPSAETVQHISTAFKKTLLELQQTCMDHYSNRRDVKSKGKSLINLGLLSQMSSVDFWTTITHLSKYKGSLSSYLQDFIECFIKSRFETLNPEQLSTELEQLNTELKQESEYSIPYNVIKMILKCVFFQNEEHRKSLFSILIIPQFMHDCEMRRNYKVTLNWINGNSEVCEYLDKEKMELLINNIFIKEHSYYMGDTGNSLTMITSVDKIPKNLLCVGARLKLNHLNANMIEDFSGYLMIYKSCIKSFREKLQMQLKKLVNSPDEAPLKLTLYFLDPIGRYLAFDHEFESQNQLLDTYPIPIATSYPHVLIQKLIAAQSNLKKLAQYW